MDKKEEPEYDKFQNDIKSDLDEKSKDLQNHKAESEENERIGIEIRCKLCYKTFSKKYYLNSHMKNLHNNFDKFPCDSCGRVFNLESNLKKHIISVHENKKDKCIHCGLFFKHVNVHVKHVHNDNPKDFKCETLVKHLCMKVC